MTATALILMFLLVLVLQWFSVVLRVCFLDLHVQHYFDSLALCETGDGDCFPTVRFGYPCDLAVSSEALTSLFMRQGFGRDLDESCACCGLDAASDKGQGRMG